MRKCKQEELSAEVDQLLKDLAPMPPGFVIRNHGEDGWSIQCEANGLTREKMARIVEAIRRA